METQNLKYYKNCINYFSCDLTLYGDNPPFKLFGIFFSKRLSFWTFGRCMTFKNSQVHTNASELEYSKSCET